MCVHGQWHIENFRGVARNLLRGTNQGSGDGSPQRGPGGMTNYRIGPHRIPLLLLHVLLSLLEETPLFHAVALTQYYKAPLILGSILLY